MCTGAETKSQFCKPLKRHVKSMMDVTDRQLFPWRRLAVVVDRTCMYPFLEL